MPVVPSYKRDAPLAIPEPAAEPGAVEMKIGEAISDIGQEMGQLSRDITKRVIEEQDKLDNTKARDILNQAIQADREYMGMQFERQGKDAVGVYDDSKSYFADRTRYWSSELENEQQRQAFLKAYRPRVNSYLNSSFDHQSQQRKAYDQATQQAFMVNAAQDAIMHRDNPAFIEESRMEIVAGVKNLPSNQGLDGEALQAEVDEAVGTFFNKVLEAKMVDNPSKAQDYYESVKDKIPAQYHAKIENALKDTVLAQESLVKAEEIAASTINPDERSKMVRGIKDAGLQDLVRQRINIINAEEKKAEINLREDERDKLIGRILASGDLHKSYDIALTATDSKDRLQLYQTARAIWGQGPVTKPDKWVEAYTDIDKNEIKKPNDLILKYQRHLSTADFKELMNYYRSGGYLKNIKQGPVAAIFSSIAGESAKDAPGKFKAVWNFVIENFPRDKQPNSDLLRDLVSKGLILGGSKGEREVTSYLGKAWYRGLGENMTYSDALKKGVEAKWLPKLDSEAEEMAIINQIKAHNKANPDQEQIKINDRSIREYKKRLIKRFGSTEVLFDEQ